MIVTKNQLMEDVEELLIKGYAVLGENRVQEAEKKYAPLRNKYNFELNLIGPLQSNKVKNALAIFDVIQSIDRLKIVDEINRLKNHTSRSNKFYIQINIGKEKQKSGVLPEKFEELYQHCINSNLTIEGIMCIPPLNVQPHKYFIEMASIRDNTNSKLKLSMGMSGDYLTALQMGSNLIRVGSMIFQ